MTNKNRSIMIRVTPEVDDKIQALCAALDLDQSSIIRLAIARLHAEAVREQWIAPLETPATE